MEIDIKKYEINPKNDTKTLDSIIEDIEKFNEGKPGGIEVEPEYQREYKFTPEDESLLIESFLLGIPVPSVYLSADADREVFCYRVIDGHHRLMAIYRFLNNKFRLTKLEKLSELNGAYFNELPANVQNILLYQRTLPLVVIPTQDDKSVELEIFKRYNKGTHPLSAQEIRNALYNSTTNKWINETLKRYYDLKEIKYVNIFNITDRRYKDKNVHEQFAIICCIFKFGLQSNLPTSPEYAEYFLNYAYSNKNFNDDSLDDIKREYLCFCELLEYIYDIKGIKHPLSKELYGEKADNYKLQIPILMIVAAFFDELYSRQKYFVKDDYERMYFVLQELRNSYLETGFKGSSTRPKQLSDTKDQLVGLYYKKDSAFI